MIYWVTETAASSARMYLLEAQAAWGEGASGDWDEAGEAAAQDEAGAEGHEGGWSVPTPPRSEVPTGFALFPREAPTPRDWVARQANLVRYTEMPRGGHFAALEEPELFAQDLRAFVSSLPR